MNAMTGKSSDDQANQRAKPRRRIWRWMCLTLVLAGLLVGWNRVVLLQAWGAFLDVGCPLSAPVDVVFLLGGGLETRPFVAAEIYRSGYADRILISQPQGHSMDFLDGQSESQLTRSVLEQLGVAGDDIFELPSPVDSTTTEVAALRDYLRDSGPAKVAVVTSDFHTRRTQVLLNRTLGTSARDVQLVSAPVDGYSPRDWWQSQQGVATYLLETVKLVTARLNL